MNIFKDANFGDMFKTKRGKELVYCGKWPHDYEDYYMVMIKGTSSLSFYKGNGEGPFIHSEFTGNFGKFIQDDIIIA